MSEEQQIKILETNLSRLLQWIAAAEARVSVVLGIATAMLGSMAIFAPAAKTWPIGIWVMVCLTLFFIGGSLVCLSKASFPRTNGPKGSLLYFEGIKARDLYEYRLAMKSLTLSMYIDDLTDQCHVNAQIASLKYSWLKNSQIYLFASIIPWTSTLFCLYQAK